MGRAWFLADDFIVIDDEGTVSTKDAEVAWLAKNAWSGPADFLYVIDRISFPASDVALVVGRLASARALVMERSPHRNLPFIERSTESKDMEAGDVPHLRRALSRAERPRATIASNA